MPKLAVLLAGAGAVIVVGGAVLIVTKKDDKLTSDTANSSSQEQPAPITVDDPDGDYAFFSDTSVTKHPENDVKFGNGQTLTFEYDGSKTANDDYATLSYQLYYIQNDGKVQPMGGGNLEGRGSGSFSTSDKVFDSAAEGRKGFLELQGTYTVGTAGTNVKLGMYPIQFDISK